MMLDQPFDRVAEIELGGHAFDAVVHLNAAGEIFAFHSPLEHGPVHCDVCKGGARVYMEVG